MRDLDKAHHGYKLTARLGVGCFGTVYEGSHIETDEPVAIKIAVDDVGMQALLREASMLACLVGESDCTHGFPRLHDWGTKIDTEGRFSFMIMERLGISLGDIFARFRILRQRLAVASSLPQQLLHRLEYMHSKCIVHKDIKPENIMFGVGARAQHVYLIDFGLSKAYWKHNSLKKGGTHIDYRLYSRAAGTPRYQSLHAHQGHEGSRRDDLESAGYLIIHLHTGTLPWAGLDITLETYPHEVFQSKFNTPLQRQCLGMHHDFLKYMVYCRKLAFRQRPDYNILHSYLESSCPEAFDQWSPVEKSDGAELEPLLPYRPLCQPDDALPSSDGKKSRSVFSFFNVLKTTLLPTRQFNKIVPDGAC